MHYILKKGERQDKSCFTSHIFFTNFKVFKLFLTVVAGINDLAGVVLDLGAATLRKRKSAFVTGAQVVLINDPNVGEIVDALMVHVPLFCDQFVRILVLIDSFPRRAINRSLQQVHYSFSSKNNVHRRAISGRNNPHPLLFYYSTFCIPCQVFCASFPT